MDLGLSTGPGHQNLEPANKRLGEGHFTDKAPASAEPRSSAHTQTPLAGCLFLFSFISFLSCLIKNRREALKETMTNRIGKTGNRTELGSPRLPTETCASGPKATAAYLSCLLWASAWSKRLSLQKKKKKIKMLPQCHLHWNQVCRLKRALEYKFCYASSGFIQPLKHVFLCS